MSSISKDWIRTKIVCTSTCPPSARTCSCGLPRTVQLVLLVRRANSDKEHAFSNPRDHGDVVRTAHPKLTVWCLQSVPSRRTASR